MKRQACLQPGSGARSRAARAAIDAVKQIVSRKAQWAMKRQAFLQPGSAACRAVSESSLTKPLQCFCICQLGSQPLVQLRCQQFFFLRCAKGRRAVFQCPAAHCAQRLTSRGVGASSPSNAKSTCLNIFFLTLVCSSGHFLTPRASLVAASPTKKGHVNSLSNAANTLHCPCPCLWRRPFRQAPWALHGAESDKGIVSL